MSLARARELVHLERWDEAAALAPALADPAADAEAWCLLAQCQLAQGNASGARITAQRALSVDPGEEWAHRLVAVAELRSGHATAARRAAERALALRPESPEGSYLLALAHLARRRRARAAEVARRAIAANPNLAISWQTATEVALARRRWVKGEQHARRGLAIDPQDAELMLHLGTALDRQGRSAEAGEVFAAAARADPRDHRGRRALGRLGIPLVGTTTTAIAVAKVGGAVGAVKAVVIVNALRAGVTSISATVIALVAAVTLGLAYAVVATFHHRAARRLRPDLRDIARRERRQQARGWLAVTTVVALIVALLGLSTGEYGTSVVLCGVAAVAPAMRRRWFRGVRPDRPLGALRDVVLTLRSLVEQFRQSIRVRRR